MAKFSGGGIVRVDRAAYLADMTLPSEPLFGAVLPVRASSAILEFLALRRSASAPTLTAPGPDSAQIRDLLRLASRVPDHGKLAPWRFIVLDGPAKAAFGQVLRQAAAVQPDPGKAGGALIKFDAPPCAVVVVARQPQAKVPVWEQELSVGAACMTLLFAAQGMGLGANWITDWYSYDATVATRLGLTPGERVAGFVYLGTATTPPQERERPDQTTLVTWWSAP